ncbi:ImmA/IrrE family metallo-endopeptidase [Paenibacillus filicis]|uniref:ImmA/IrrE family metallo-endopeptidase n=1 Tax=Paenibacillus filicis TaxID=669464 RepID=A0ABU9DW49_9BACL
MNIELKLARRFKTNNPFVIAQGLGIDIRYADLGPSTRGIYLRKLKHRCIFISNNLDDHWQRFVCAHELGHDRLHPGISRFWLDKNTLYNAGKYERQANVFALNLLTVDLVPHQLETIEDFLVRNSIPKEMAIYY